MELVMGVRGERLAEFLRSKLRERKGSIDGYKDSHFAAELGVEYTTLKNWLSAKSIERIDIDNFFALEDKFGRELIDYLKGK